MAKTYSKRCIYLISDHEPRREYKDLGWDPDAGQLGYWRTYHKATVHVSRDLIGGKNSKVVRKLNGRVSEHTKYVDTGSILHSLLAGNFPDHKGWGYFGVSKISKRPTHFKLEIEYRSRG